MDRNNREMYNADLKEKFLKNYDEHTARTNRFAFLKTSEIAETKLNKDLYGFTEDEIESLLYALEAKSYQSILTYVAIISKYIEYCIDNHVFMSENINILSQNKFKGQNLLKYVSKESSKDKYITKEELEDICNICINYQDEVIFRLLFEGVKGGQLSELINLKVSNVNFTDNKIKIYGENEREISVSAKLISTIEEAINQEEYENYVVGVGSRVKVRRLHYTGYILKKSNNKGEDKIAYQSIIQRLKRVRAEAGYPILTVETIWWSGIFDYATKIIKRNGRLADKDYDEIIERFGCSKERAYKYKVINNIKSNI